MQKRITMMLLGIVIMGSSPAWAETWVLCSRTNVSGSREARQVTALGLSESKAACVKEAKVKAEQTENGPYRIL